MARHSFIQMSKLPNVKGRIDYISSEKRQENLYATYQTAGMDFWRSLARESQQEFKRSGAEGKCIEARELIIALPENYTRYDPDKVLRDFTDQLKKRYGVECVSALHHNKTKRNYHIHLIFSERRLLDEPDIKIASRAVYYDESGKRVRTKKEITGEDGQIREGCTVIKKGEVYEQHLFSPKDDMFKSKVFLDEAKQFYTALINRHVKEPEQRLKVFDPDSIYLPTKKIGKNNPKADEIRADNEARQEWNRMADMALVVGIAEATILEVKQEKIHNETANSIQTHGWLPGLFRGIVQKAKSFLERLIRQQELPQKPTLNIDIDEFNALQDLLTRLQQRAREAKRIQEIELPMLQAELADAKGFFKGKERKVIEAKIAAAEKEVSDLKAEISDIVKIEGYPDGQAFMAAYSEAKRIVSKYRQDMAAWRQQAECAPAEKPQRRSIRAELRRLDAKVKRHPRKAVPRSTQMDVREDAG